jgi:hypothetical protein
MFLKIFQNTFKVIDSIVVISNMFKTKLHSLEKRPQRFFVEEKSVSSEVKLSQCLRDKISAEVAITKSENERTILNTALPTTIIGQSQHIWVLIASFAAREMAIENLL